MFLAKPVVGFMSGSLLAAYCPQTGPRESAWMWAIIGLTTLAGPVLGSFILSPLSEALRAFGTLRIVFYALVIVLFVVFRSEGILNYLQRKYEQIEHWVEV